VSEFIIVQSLNGLVYSMLLFVFALGLSTTFGLLRFVNLAHGSFFLLGAYAGISMLAMTGSFATALLSGALVAGVIGLGLERIFFRKFYRRIDLDQVIVSYGLALVFGDIAKMIWGKDIRSLPAPEWLAGGIEIASVTFPVYRLLLIVLGCVLFVGTWLVIERTRIGALIRATVDDRDMVGGMGFDVRPLFALVFAAGAALAGLGGVFAGPITSVYPGLDFETLITALIVVVVGGLGSITGAFWASLLIGVTDTFGRALFPDSAAFLIFALMALVLLIRSWGVPEEEME
jgi:branched-subunit amino acid ABC-type transport system permease component